MSFALRSMIANAGLFSEASLIALKKGPCTLCARPLFCGRSAFAEPAEARPGYECQSSRTNVTARLTLNSVMLPLSTITF